MPFYSERCATLENRISIMLPIRKRIFVLLCFPCLIFSCTPAQERNEQKQEMIDSTTYSNIVSELTPEQQSAFDALNTLQISTDEQNRLYSTFADIAHPCFPPDTSFVISQSELLTAMMQFVKENCSNLNIEKQEELATTAVLAQKEYTVLYCPGHSSNMNYGKGIPRKGTWVMPSVLGRRDVTLVW